MTFCKRIRFTLKSRSANFTRLNHTPFVYSESRDGLRYLIKNGPGSPQGHRLTYTDQCCMNNNG
ncbi:hypothetical protein [Rubritalea tangerina]|uniref:hypothetical protein n=1 Tax=Rubritalea tangerina TaxID=430798 RepID=UPI0036157852